MNISRIGYRLGRSIPAAHFLTCSLSAKTVGLVAGLVLIRTMPPSEYGRFILVTSLSGLIGILTDVGIAPALTANAARAHVSHGSSQVPLVAQGVLKIRTGRLLYAVPVAVGIATYQRGLAPQFARDVVAAVGLATVLGLSSIAVATLSSCVSATGRAEVVAASDLRAATLRSLCICLALFLDCLSSGLAVMLMIGANLSILVRLTRVYSDQLSGGTALVDGDYSTRLMADIRRDGRALLPNYAYFSLAGALPALLLSSTASAGGLAEYGAYGRIGLMFGALAPLLAMKLIPYAAKTHSRVLVRKANLVLVLILIGSISSCLIASHFDLGRLVLGSQYGAVPATLVSAILYFWLRFGADSLFSMMVGVRGQALHVYVVLAASIILILTLGFGLFGRDAAGMYAAMSSACLVELLGCWILVGVIARQGD